MGVERPKDVDHDVDTVTRRHRDVLASPAMR